MHHRSIQTLFPWLIIGLFCLLVLMFGVNAPQQDDYDSILVYLLGSQNSFLDGLFDVHVSHRLVVTRLLARLSMLTGQGLELRLLILVGTASLLGVAALIYRNLRTGRDEDDRPYLLAILCLSLFSLFHWSNMVWASASVQNYTSLLAAILALHLFSRRDRASRSAAVAMGLLAPYISSGGLLVLPLLLAWSLVPALGGREGLRMSIWLAIACAASFAVFFLLPEGQPVGGGSLLTGVLDPFALPGILLAYLIACAGYLHFAPLAIAAGLFVNVYFALLVRLGYWRSNPVLFFLYLYLLLSLLLVAIFRFEMGTGFLIASRYQVYTLLIDALVVVSFVELGLEKGLGIRRFRPVLLVLFSLLYLASFYYLGNLVSERKRILDGIQAWRASGAPTLYHPRPEQVGSILEQSIALGLYRLPPEGR